MDHPGTRLELRAAEALLSRCEPLIADMKRDLVVMGNLITDLYHTIDIRLATDQQTDQVHLIPLFELRQHSSRMRSLCNSFQSCPSFGRYEQDKEYLAHLIVWISKEQYDAEDEDRSMIWDKNERMVAKVRERVGMSYSDLTGQSDVVARVAWQVARFLTDENENDILAGDIHLNMELRRRLDDWARTLGQIQ